MPSDLPPHGGVVVLDYGFGRKAAASAAAAATRRAPSEQRRRGGNANANGGSASFAAAAFLREEAIQPAAAAVAAATATGNGRSGRSCGESSNTNPSTVGSKKRRCPHLAPNLLRQQRVQPSRVAVVEDDGGDDDKRHVVCSGSGNNNDRSKPAKARGGKRELRIGDKTETGVIDEIKAKTNCFNARGSTSVYLKGIRRESSSPHGGVDPSKEDDSTQSASLPDALKDLIRNQGSSWKRIRLHECSPSVLELLLDSPHSANLEEIYLVGLRDDDDDDDDDDDEQQQQQQQHQGRPGDLDEPITAPQAQEPPPPQSRSVPSAAPAPPGRASAASLILSLLKKTTRIKRLVLRDCKLENLDLLRTMNTLCAHPKHPTSLEHLDLRFNRFTPKAVQSVLAIHLRASLHSLKTVKLRQGIRCVVHRNTRDAILRGLRCNRVVLESIDIFDWDKSVRYLLDVNRAKRRAIFCNHDLFSRNLWPHLLGQAVTAEIANNDNDDDDGFRKPSRPLSRPSLFPPGRISNSSKKRQASVVYHMFRNGGPMLLQQHYPIENCSGLATN